MSNIHELRTERLLLRQWLERDLEPFSAMSADPEVMAYFPSTLTPEQAAGDLARYREKIVSQGFGFWATERRSDGQFIGIVGLSRVDDLPIDDSVEVGWRLARPYWGQGYATEAAGACLHFAFNDLVLPEVIAITTVNNLRSQAVMRRLGMQDTGRNFDHPRVPAESELREHVLYRVSRDDFQQHAAADQSAPRGIR